MTPQSSERAKEAGEPEEAAAERPETNTGMETTAVMAGAAVGTVFSTVVTTDSVMLPRVSEIDWTKDRELSPSEGPEGRSDSEMGAMTREEEMGEGEIEGLEIGDWEGEGETETEGVGVGVIR